ncbi:Rpn family recombination-promoting nuclease/putative transposase [Olivibacter sitiensis]|uniref:Rpn family recombination-promoting nuclease/putative transposase n=1 Tax=Olivibacter sitiensis TaxID=376470 RepID=UPI0003FC4015|nr:Rpn family recombination-promoting nuclease/putative transposase [Olivibacter sitiensis]
MAKQASKSRYIDLTTDFGFKRVFGTEPNKDLLKAFLNEVFRGRKEIVDLVYNKNEHVGDIEEIGSVIFDLTCTADNGEKFIIEVQRSAQVNFIKRTLYYGSKLITDQAPKGRRKEWGYGISEVYVIVLMDGFAMPDGDDGTSYLHDICLCNRDTGKVFYDDLGFIYLELVNFVKEESELGSYLDGWLFVLKNMGRLDRIPLYLRKPIFEKLFDIAEYSKLSTEEKEMYDTSLKQKWDNTNALAYARQEGEVKGLEKGRQEERAKAEAEKLDIAREMKKDGLPIVQIAKFTKLSIEVIEKL